MTLEEYREQQGLIFNPPPRPNTIKQEPEAVGAQGELFNPARLTYIFRIKPHTYIKTNNRHKHSEQFQRYLKWKNTLKLIADRQGFIMPADNYHLIFHLAMPKSWSRKKKYIHTGTFHKKRPDRDNLEKAFNDAICSEDSHLADARVTKLYSDVNDAQGYIEIRKLDPKRELEIAISDFLMFMQEQGHMGTVNVKALIEQYFREKPKAGNTLWT